mmetsp:Transcript_22620/g.59773  ORF Transcript_22620/g.59773 Transcript_22620/m.59773 type:complete len:298 (+) Transcript_22620:645-1538(+)
MMTPAEYSLQSPSSRLARFTASPMQPNFIRVSVPMLPLRTLPVFSPMRIVSRGRPSVSSCTLSSSTAFCWARAASQAFSAWPATSCGVFQKARMPSPRISPTVPLYISTMRIMTDRYRVMRKRESRCGRVSQSQVKSCMSENMIETTRSSTWRRRCRPENGRSSCAAPTDTKRPSVSSVSPRPSTTSCSRRSSRKGDARPLGVGRARSARDLGCSRAEAAARRSARCLSGRRTRRNKPATTAAVATPSETSTTILTRQSSSAHSLCESSRVPSTFFSAAPSVSSFSAALRALSLRAK